MTKPKWMRTDKTPREFEEEEAKRLGGKRHKASGAMWHLKADVSNQDILEEDKTTDNIKYQLDAEVLNKLIDEANKVGKSSQFVVYFNKYGLRVTITPERI